MNSSEALKARRDAERAERRRSERLQERADEQAEREREEARAEDRRREEARDEAEARAAEERQRERRQERLAQLRKVRLATARQERKRGERRLLAKRELDDNRRAQIARERAAGERRAEAGEQAATARRAQEREATARAERLDEQQAERRDAEGEQERRALREAELRKADIERRASDRREAQAEAERRVELLEEERLRLREERSRSDARAAQAERLRAEALARAQEERRREQLAAARRAELQSAARTARVQQRAAAQAASERAAELRAEQAARRLSERRELASREQRDRERTAAAGSERRGELEDAVLPWLRTDNGVLVAWGGQRVLLRGVSARGLDEAVAAGTPLPEALALDDRNLEQLSERWGANVVRLPFGAETIAAADLAELDELAGTLAASGLYTLLALEPPVIGGETPLPDAGAHRAWRLLAERYQAEPGVLFEPYAAAAPLADGWPAAAIALVHTIRSRHQSSLLLLPEQGGELGPVHNLVYTIRLAPDLKTRLDERLTAFASREAMLVSDWREDGVDPAGPATATAGLLERHQLSWCAGNWNAAPRLVADAAANRLTETRFGLVVRRALAAPAPPALTPF